MMYIISCMRYPATHKDRTRERIVQAASRRFRAQGSEGVAIADLMRDLSLTHGGFYRHFKGKEELFDEALVEGFRQSETRMKDAIAAAPAGHEIEAVIHTYLSDGHCAHPSEGCPIAALSTEIARHPRRTRSTLGQALQARVLGLARFVPGKTKRDRERTAQVLLAGMAGVLSLARAIPDEAQRRALLEGARAFYVQAVCRRD